jgi:hypothetical protein
METKEAPDLMGDERGSRVEVTIRHLTRFERLR